eukprot:TRINITY_DN3555_c0_g1_i4.p1 TRINITY_DN3555_c0_g1~~TRINITY_DN3555_c0_g1_i4.p1  ORF type:complete len:1271 (+),score=446.37 TRINITY_DN3555_c0_g1_i4:64-3813(+)
MESPQKDPRSRSNSAESSRSLSFQRLEGWWGKSTPKSPNIGGSMVYSSPKTDNKKSPEKNRGGGSMRSFSPFRRKHSDQTNAGEEKRSSKVYLWDHRKDHVNRLALDGDSSDFEELKAIYPHIKGKISSVTFDIDKLLVLTDKGDVRSLQLVDMFKVTPSDQLYSLSSIRIKQVSCGAQHSLFLSDVGRVYGSGNNDDGQLGIGEEIEKVPIPIPIPFFDATDGVRVCHVSTGGRHSAAITVSSLPSTDGSPPQEITDAWCWGCSRNGRCGNGDPSSERLMIPTKIKIDDLSVRRDVVISDIVCGWSHTLILIQKAAGRTSFLYSFGRGSNGQCGQDNHDDIFSPTIVKDLVSQRITQISAGYYHTAVLVQGGVVWTFGGNTEGQCGNGNTHNVLRPQIVADLQELPITLICCGAFNTLAFYPGTLNLSPPPLIGGAVSKLFCWGECGSEKVTRPREVKSMATKNILHLSGGMYKSLAIIETNDDESSEQIELYEKIGLPFTDKFVDSFVCSLDVKDDWDSLLQGQLYISSQRLCFYTKTLEEVVKIVASFAEILSIERCISMMGQPDAIQIFLPQKRYRFLCSGNREEIMQVLKDMWIAHHSETPFGARKTMELAFTYLTYTDQPNIKQDVYGFPLEEGTSEQYNTWALEYSKDMEKRLQAWQQLYRQRGGIELTLENRGKSVKQLIRRGIPPELRGDLWYRLSGAADKASMNNNYYDYLLAFSDTQSNPRTVNNIDLDLHRTFPEHAYFQSNIGREKLRRVLLAFSIRNPAIGYCQSMNILAGVLLMFMDEERAFWSLAQIVEDLLPNYFLKSMMGVLVDHAVFEKQLIKKVPVVGNLLLNLGFPITAVTVKWFVCLFFTSVPSETALQVWDCFFSEGFSVMFPVGAAIFKLNTKALTQCQQIEVSFLLKSNPRKLFDFQQLLQTGLKEIEGFFDEKEFLAQRREQYEIQSKIHREEVEKKKMIKQKNKEKHVTLKMQVDELEKQEKLLKNWKRIAEEEKMESHELADHIVSIVQFVCESENVKASLSNIDTSKKFSSSCMNILIEKKILHHFVEISVHPDIIAATLKAFANLVQSISVDTLANPAVSEPIITIMEEASQANESEILDKLLTLVSSLLDKLLTEDAFLIIQTIPGKIPSFPIFPTVVNHLKNPEFPEIAEKAQSQLLRILACAQVEVQNYFNLNLIWLDTIMVSVSNAFEAIFSHGKTNSREEVLAKFGEYSFNLKYLVKCFGQVDRSIQLVIAQKN